ncbi:MAG: deoxyribodipyrimidine photo-lyase [Caldilineaceae bacterium]
MARQPTDQRQEILAAPKALNTPETIASDPLPTFSTDLLNTLPFPPGENVAKARLSDFVKGSKAPIYDYAQNRNIPFDNATSQLSPYLRFGMISARLAALGAYTALENTSSAEKRKGAATWLNELIWRDFYITILAEFPHVRQGAFRAEYDAIGWINDQADFDAWSTGHTGYPFVDAAMRQLRTIGWMHNRARMVVASFLVKDLLIDWRWGERWFMQQLVDGDPAANNGGWQWSAGTGTDAAPYFRVFNPISQSEKFDAQGNYIRRWVPELEKVPNKFIHTPWKMPKTVQQSAECRIGSDYPAPIVDHKNARERALAAYKAVK